MTAQEFNQLFGGVLFETLKNPDLARIMETDGVATNLNNLMQELSQAAARAYSWVNKNLKEGEDIQKLFNDDGAKLMRACYTKLAAVNDRFKGLSSSPKYSGRITAETRKLFDRVSNEVGKKEENVENIGGKLNSAEKIKVNKGYYFPDSQFSNQYKIDPRKSQNNLFAHIPCAEDVVQEDNLACYFLAPLRVIAAKHPEKILDLVHDNGDGTVTFKLYPLDGNMDTNFTGKKNEMLITVDNTLPGIDPQSRRWVRLFEKALAASRTMNIAGHMPDKEDLKKKIDMNSFEGGEPLVSLSVLDPTNSGSYTGREKANKMLVSMNNMLDVNKVLAKQINDAKEKGKLMCLCSGVHVFTVTDIETDIAGEVTLKCYDQQRQKNFDVTLDSMLEGKSYERYDRFVIYDYGDQGKSHDASYFSLNEIRNSVQLHSMDPNYKVPLRTKDWVDGVLNGEITSQVEFAEEDNKKLEELIDKILDAGIFDDIYELTDVWGRIDHIKKGTYKEDLPLDDYEKEYLNDLTREHLWIRLSEMRKENEVAPEDNEEQKPEEQHVEEVKLEEPVKQAEAPMPNDISLGIAYREMMRHNDVISSILECRPDDFIMPEGLSENEKTAELLKLLQNDSMRLSKLNDDDRTLMMVKIDSVLSAWKHGDYDDKLAIPTSVKAHRDLITAEVLYDRIAKIQDQNEINYTKILADAKKANEEIIKEEAQEEPVPVKEDVKEEIVQEEVKEEIKNEAVQEEVKEEAVQEEGKEDPVQEEVKMTAHEKHFFKKLVKAVQGINELKEYVKNPSESIGKENALDILAPVLMTGTYLETLPDKGRENFIDNISIVLQQFGQTSEDFIKHLAANDIKLSPAVEVFVRNNYEMIKKELPEVCFEETKNLQNELINKLQAETGMLKSQIVLHGRSQFALNHDQKVDTDEIIFNEIASAVCQHPEIKKLGLETAAGLDENAKALIKNVLESIRSGEDQSGTFVPYKHDAYLRDTDYIFETVLQWQSGIKHPVEVRKASSEDIEKEMQDGVLIKFKPDDEGSFAQQKEKQQKPAVYDFDKDHVVDEDKAKEYLTHPRELAPEVPFDADEEEIKTYKELLSVPAINEMFFSADKNAKKINELNAADSLLLEQKIDDKITSAINANSDQLSFGDYDTDVIRHFIRYVAAKQENLSVDFNTGEYDKLKYAEGIQNNKKYFDELDKLIENNDLLKSHLSQPVPDYNTDGKSGYLDAYVKNTDTYLEKYYNSFDNLSPGEKNEIVKAAEAAAKGHPYINGADVVKYFINKERDILRSYISCLDPEGTNDVLPGVASVPFTYESIGRNIGTRAKQYELEQQKKQEAPQQVITSQAVALYDVKYGNVLNKLAKDLESTKGFFTRDSDAFKRLNEYLNSVDDFSNLDKDALDEAIDNIRGLVNDYQNHMKNKPIDNDRRRNREGIADKLSAICDEYSSDEPKNYADSIINRDECYGVIKEELGKKAGYDIPALKDAFGRLMIMNIMDAKAHGKHQLGSFDEDAVSDYAEKFANTDTVMKMIKDVGSLKALVADYEANPGLLSTKTESKLAADMLKNMANEKNIDKKLADERTAQKNDNSMQMK